MEGHRVEHFESGVFDLAHAFMISLSCMDLSVAHSFLLLSGVTLSIYPSNFGLFHVFGNY